MGRDVSGETLAAHNAVRSRAGVPPLVWSEKLAAVAQDWAQELIARGEFRHRPRDAKGHFGENLLEVRGASATVLPERVVAMRAEEASHYDYRSNHCSGVCGHYTQIAWRGNREVGCGVARGNRHEVWVCNYDPPGT